MVDVPNELRDSVLNNKEFDNLLEQELKHIKNYFEKPQAGWMPELKILHKNATDDTGTITVVAFGDLSADNKHEAFQSIGAMAYDEGIKKGIGPPVAVMFTSEAWMKNIEGKKAQEEFKKSGKRISEYDDKVECLATSGMSVDGRINMAVHDIKRDKNNKITGVKLSRYAPHSDENAPKVESALLQSFFRGCYLAHKKWKENQSAN